MLRIKEIPFLGTKNVKISWGAYLPDPPRRDCLWRLIITIRLLGNFCQLLEKLWTTLLTLKMASTQVVETSVNVTTNTFSLDYTHLVDHTLPTYDMPPGFKLFTVDFTYMHI